jgi:hypothetical protein
MEVAVRRRTLCNALHRRRRVADRFRDFSYGGPAFVVGFGPRRHRDPLRIATSIGTQATQPEYSGDHIPRAARESAETSARIRGNLPTQPDRTPDSPARKVILTFTSVYSYTAPEPAGLADQPLQAGTAEWVPSQRQSPGSVALQQRPRRNRPDLLLPHLHVLAAELEHRRLGIRGTARDSNRRSPPFRLEPGPDRDRRSGGVPPTSTVFSSPLTSSMRASTGYSPTSGERLVFRKSHDGVGWWAPYPRTIQFLGVRILATP